ncbi:hypothetical protein [Pedobacter africanus]|uniref:Uncharacterized protein n=1 Tax=Pedobacter africanus TaxID=151894 RepID=A0A1W1ZV60_9SPHI|nr:hypothetical protein [Pedobacter africanus]SMC52329.1 hypothetical protein SAMN04488524_1005 [Pedobacter africanus]
MKKLKENAGGVTLSRAEQKVIVGGSIDYCLDLNEECFLGPNAGCCPNLTCVDDLDGDDWGYCVPVGN